LCLGVIGTVFATFANCVGIYLLIKQAER
jgi:hypothetical protein